MSGYSTFRTAALLFTLLVPGSLPAQGEPGPAADATAGDVVSIDLLIEDAARPAWSAQGDLIAFDRAGVDGLYDLWIRNLDTGGQRCLTCEMFAFRKTHVLSADWHPSGDYLVALVQQNARKLELGPLDLLTADRALHTDLWLIRADGKDHYQLTRTSDIGSAVLEPHFSHEGDRLVWSERFQSREGRYGSWRLRQAKVRFGRRIPRLGKTEKLGIGDKGTLLLAHEFTADDSGVLLAGNLESGQSVRGLDIYVARAGAAEPIRLTHSRGGRDEFAHASPDGRHIAWTSNAELRPERDPGRRLPFELRSELWLMKADGSDKRRLTRFNDPLSEESLGAAYVGDFAWSREGDRILFHVVRGSVDTRQSLYVVQLASSFRR